MEYKNTIYIFIIILLIVSINDTVDYLNYKQLLKNGEITGVIQKYVYTKDNYDYYFKTVGGEMIAISKSLNNKRLPSYDKYMLTAKIIYDKSNPKEYDFFPYKYSSFTFIKKTSLFYLIALLIFSSIYRVIKYLRKNELVNPNFDNYKNDYKYKKLDKYIWIFKKYNELYFFIGYSFIMLYVFFGFTLFFFSFGFIPFKGFSLVLSSIIFIGFVYNLIIKLKYFGINNEYITFFYWIISWKKKDIKISDINDIIITKKRRDEKFIEIVLKKKKITINSPFSKKVENDLFLLIKSLIKRNDNIEKEDSKKLKLLS